MVTPGTQTSQGLGTQWPSPGKPPPRPAEELAKGEGDLEWVLEERMMSISYSLQIKFNNTACVSFHLFSSSPTSTLGKFFPHGANFLQTASESDSARDNEVLHSQSCSRTNVPLPLLIEIWIADRSKLYPSLGIVLGHSKLLWLFMLFPLGSLWLVTSCCENTNNGPFSTAWD